MSGTNRHQQAWDEACAEADRLDPGWRWEDLLARRPVLPPEEDAIAVTLAAAAKLPPGWPDWTPAVNSDVLPEIPLKKWPNTPENLAFRRTMLIESQIEQTPDNQHLESRIPLTLKELISQVKEPLAITSNLATLIAGRPPGIKRPILLNIPKVEPFRYIARVSHYQSLMLAEHGEIDEALAIAQRMLGAARAAVATPMLIMALANFAIRHLFSLTVQRVLAHGEASRAKLIELQAMVETALTEPILWESIRGERAVTEDLVRAFDEGLTTRKEIQKFKSLLPMPVTGWRYLDSWIEHLREGGFSHRRQARVLQYYTQLMQLLSESPDALIKDRPAFAALRANGGRAVDKHHQSIEMVAEADRKQRSRLSALATALATEVFRFDVQRWPVGLHELVPINIARLPVDPYDFEPLKLAINADGITIFATGLQPQDEVSQVSTYLGGMRQGFIGIRLWNRDQRGLRSK